MALRKPKTPPTPEQEVSGIVGQVRREAHTLPSGPGAGPTGQTEWDPITVLGVPNVAGCADTG